MTSLAEDRNPATARHSKVDQGLIRTPEDDLAGCVVGTRSCSAGGLPGLQVKVEKAAAATFGRFPHREEARRDWAALQSVDPGRDGCPRCCSSGGMKRCCIGRWATLRAHAPTIGCPRVAVERSAPEFQAWRERSMRR
jgi:hypothetical protein